MKTIQTILLVALVLGGITLLASAETIDWADDFDDGNYTGWTLQAGTFQVDDGSLLSTMTGELNRISHPSTRSNGTWLFDVYEDLDTGDEFEFVFCATELALTDLEGYSVHMGKNDLYPTLTIYRWNYSSIFDRSLRTPLLHYNFPEGYENTGWISYNVTRTQDGDIHVLRDGESVLSAMWTGTENRTHEEYEFGNILNISEYVVIRSTDSFRFDNIVVGEDLTLATPTTTTETTTATETLTDTTTPTATPTILDEYNPILYLVGPVILLGAIVVIVLVVVVMKRSR